MALQDLCRQYGIRFKKALGQNLLLDDNINRIMLDAAAVSSDDDVIEVGAGLGALTQRLADRAGRLLSIEIDASFMPCLEDQFGQKRHVKLFRGDVLNHTVEKLIDEFLPGAERYKLVANLPYYITTPILFHFWEASVPFERIVVMVQEEVGHRMTAKPNASDYGALSLAAQYYGEVDIVHKVPASCFVPRPKVDSCIVRIRARKEPLYPEVKRTFLFKLIRAAFSKRRKTLRNALTTSGAFGVPKETVLTAFEESGIDGGRRAQTLSLDEFATLTDAIQKRM